jgi:hypothetical protein
MDAAKRHGGARWEEPAHHGAATWTVAPPDLRGRLSGDPAGDDVLRARSAEGLAARYCKEAEVGGCARLDPTRRPPGVVERAEVEVEGGVGGEPLA